MALLQKRALYGLILGIAFTIAIITVFITRGGVMAYAEDAVMRVIVAGLWVGALVTNLIVINITLRKPGQVDERDRLIVSKATRIQLLAVIFTIVAWSIALTEVYWDQGHIPIIFPYLVLMSVLITSTIAQCAGILIGYRRGVSHGG